MSDDPSPLPSGGRSSPRQTRGKTSDLYATITARMIELLEKGVVPWRSPIIGQRVGYPRNLVSGNPYRGVNVFLLAVAGHFQGYESAYWLTFKQARDAGGNVKRGEKATLVVFFKPHEVKDKETGEVKKVPLLRHFHVFNVAQCEGVKAPDSPAPLAPPVKFRPIQEAVRIVQGYKDAPVIEHEGARAFYRPKTDTVRMPEPEKFTSPEEYYGTLFHELAHSTGHSKRLDRGLDTNLAPFGSPDYSREELVAEMAAAFLCGHAGIHPVVVENQAAYLKGWLGRLRQDSKLIVTAASAAQRAAEWIRKVPETGEAELDTPMADPT